MEEMIKSRVRQALLAYFEGMHTRSLERGCVPIDKLDNYELFVIIEALKAYNALQEDRPQ